MSLGTNRKGKSYWIHSIFVLMLMFVLPAVITPIEPLTKQGMYAICIFVGLLWAWTFVDFIWPSLLAMIAVGASGFMSIDAALLNGWGNSTPVMLFFIFVLTAYLNESRLCQSVTYWLISRKVFLGRPYMIILAIFLAVFLVGSTASGMAAVLLCWSIAYEIFGLVGYQKGDKEPMLLIVGIMFVTVLAQCLFPFRPIAAMGINSMKNAVGLETPYALFTLVSFSIIVLAVIWYFVLMRFVFRADFSRLRDAKETFIQYGEKVSFTNEQKVAAIVLVFVVVGALAPSFLPANWFITKFFSKFTITSLIVLSLSLVAAYNMGVGKGFDFARGIKNGMDWGTVIMIMGSMPSAALMQHADSGVTTMINNVMIGLVGDLSPFLIGLIFLIFAAIVTQFAHNVVMILVLTPILATLSTTMGFNPIPVLILTIFGANIGFVTPGASAWGAIMYGQREWLPSKYAFMYAALAAVGTIVLMCVIGLPLANMLM